MQTRINQQSRPCCSASLRRPRSRSPGGELGVAGRPGSVGAGERARPVRAAEHAGAGRVPDGHEDHAVVRERRGLLPASLRAGGEEEAGEGLRLPQPARGWSRGTPSSAPPSCRTASAGKPKSTPSACASSRAVITGWASRLGAACILPNTRLCARSAFRDDCLLFIINIISALW
jgi:hypothetical protein